VADVPRRHRPLDEEYPTWEADLKTIQSEIGFSPCLAEVALLRYHGLRAKEIAGRLSIPLATVNGRFRRIRDEFAIRGALALVRRVAVALRSNQ
jgi:hypothetical protein